MTEEEELTLEHLEQEINYLASRVSALSGTVGKINSEYFSKIEKCMDNLQVLTDFMEQDPKFRMCKCKCNNKKKLLQIMAEQRGMTKE